MTMSPLSPPSTPLYTPHTQATYTCVMAAALLAVALMTPWATLAALVSASFLLPSLRDLTAYSMHTQQWRAPSSIRGRWEQWWASACDWTRDTRSPTWGQQRLRTPEEMQIDALGFLAIGLQGALLLVILPLAALTPTLRSAGISDAWLQVAHGVLFTPLVTALLASTQAHALLAAACRYAHTMRARWGSVPS